MSIICDPIPGVTDSERRLNIWNTVPGNSVRSKLDDMEIVPEDSNEVVNDFGAAIIGSEFREEKKALDTFTYRYVIKKGFVPQTYTDEPYIIPYIADKNAPVVIVIPGGGFGYVTSDFAEYEGKTIALDINSRGISAVVLHYRTNPYHFPLPLLDVQRAVRYIRANSEKLGVNANSIGMIGFSAGGYEVAGFLNMVRGRDLFQSDYIPDEIDRIDDNVSNAALVYPVCDYYFNVPMLFCSFDASEVRDSSRCRELLKLTDVKEHFSSADVPQFVTYGEADTVVGTTGARDYCVTAKNRGTNIDILPIADGNHGFFRNNYITQYLDWLEKHA